MFAKRYQQRGHCGVGGGSRNDVMKIATLELGFRDNMGSLCV